MVFLACSTFSMMGIVAEAFQLGLSSRDQPYSKISLSSMDSPVMRQSHIDGQGDIGKLLHKVGVVGKDNRRRLPASLRRSTRPKIGLLYDKRTGSLCTAFCVARNVIATAAHCIYNADNRSAKHYSSYVFRLPGTRSGFSRLAGYKRNRVARYIIAGTRLMSKNARGYAHQDWALIKLSKNYCKRKLTLRTSSIDGLVRASRKNRIFQMAFHLDFKHWKQAYSGSCRVSRSFRNASRITLRKNFPGADKMLFHTCDTGVVSSGSPILMKSRGRPVAVAINVGAYQQIQKGKPKTVANTAVPVSRFAKFVRGLSRKK